MICPLKNVGEGSSLVLEESTERRRVGEGEDGRKLVWKLK